MAGRPTYLVIAPNPWDGPWMNRQQLLSRIGVDATVVYTTGVPQRGRTKGGTGGLRGRFVRRDHVWLDHPPAWLVRPWKPRWLRQLVDRQAARRWRQFAGRLGQKPLVAYLFHPKFWPYVAHLRPDRIVYHAYDLYHLQGRGPYAFASEETALAQAADLVVASSPAIADHLRSRGARYVEVVENAADFDHFSSVTTADPEPPDLAAIPRPRVAYVGALNRKVDFPLMLTLATALPGVHFVLVGQLGRLDEACVSAVTGLQGLPNVHFLGFKNPADLPAYVAHMDVNTMMYRLGDEVWTAGIYPLKLHEYLAAGRAVVSADLPTVRPFADVVRIALTPADWADAIRAAIRGEGTGTSAQRQARARENSWTSRAERLGRLLSAMISRPTRHGAGTNETSETEERW